MKKQIISFGTTLCVAASALAIDHTFVGDNANWTDPANWSPEPLAWTAADRAILPVGSTAIFNNILGSDSDAPTIVIESGATLVWPATGVNNLYSPIVLNGGTFDIRKGYIFIDSTFLVSADSTILFDTHEVCNLQSPISGDKTLTISGRSSANSWPTTLRMMVPSPNFTGILNVLGRVYVDKQNAFPAATVRVGPGGFYSIAAPQNSPLILAGGTLRNTGERVTYSGPITLTADSYMDTIAWCNDPLRIESVITGSHNITLGAALDGGGDLGNGTIRFSGDFTNWFGDLVGLVRDSEPRRIQSDSGHLHAGAFITPNGASLMLNTRSDWTLVNDFTGPWDISVGEDARWFVAPFPFARLLTLDGGVITPARENGLAGALDVYGRLSLANATVNLRLLDALNSDKINVMSIDSNPALTIADSVLNVTCDYDAGPTDVVILIFNNAPGHPVVGIFNDAEGNPLPEGAELDLGFGRTARVTYMAGPNANSVALTGFTTSAAHVAPQISNTGATEILSHSTILNAQILAGTPVPSTFFCYGEIPGSTDTNTWQHVIPMGGQSSGFFTTIYDLVPEREYHYTTLAINHDGTDWHSAWGDVLAFTSRVIETQRWSNVGWHQDDGVYKWSSPDFWSPRLPASSGDVAIISAGSTANMFFDLGVARNRPRVIVEPGATLFMRPNDDNSVSETPIELQGSTLRWSWDPRPLRAPIRVTGDSLFTNADGEVDVTNGADIGPVSAPSGVTISTRGSFAFRDPSTDLHCDWIFGGGYISYHHDTALGDGAVHLLFPATRLSFSWGWNNHAMTLYNTLNGFGVLYSGNHDNGVTLAGSVTPGNDLIPGTLTVDAPLCKLAATATLDLRIVNAQSNAMIRAVYNSTINNAPVFNPAFTVVLDNPALNISAFSNTRVRHGDVIVLLHNTGENPISGTFKDLPEGRRVRIGDRAMATLTYTHAADEDGAPNDIALIHIGLDGTLFFLK